MNEHKLALIVGLIFAIVWFALIALAWHAGRAHARERMPSPTAVVAVPTRIPTRLRPPPNVTPGVPRR